MRDSKGRFVKGNVALNKGVKNSTGNHKGENNSYHKLTDEQKTQFAKAGAAKVNSQSHLYSEKKSQAMQRKIVGGYRPQNNAGWGKGYREGNFDHEEVDICVSQLIENHLGI